MLADLVHERRRLLVERRLVWVQVVQALPGLVGLGVFLLGALSLLAALEMAATASPVVP